MVSNARLDLPEPDSPVITVSVSRGMSTLTSLRLCSRAPRTDMWVSMGVFVPDLFGSGKGPSPLVNGDYDARLSRDERARTYARASGLGRPDQCRRYQRSMTEDMSPVLKPRQRTASARWTGLLMQRRILRGNGRNGNSDCDPNRRYGVAQSNKSVRARSVAFRYSMSSAIKLRGVIPRKRCASRRKCGTS